MWKSILHHLILTIIYLSACFANPLTLKNADAAEDSQDNSPSLKGANVRILRLAIVKAFTDVRQKLRRMSMRLEWDLLPEERESIREAARNNFVKPITITIPNDSLGNPGWTRHLSKYAREKLKKALFVDKLSPFNYVASLEGFRNFWVKSNGQGAKLIREEIEDPLLAKEFYSVMLEFNIINFLLQSRGIEYYFDVSGVPVIGDFPRIRSKDITWVINIYEFKKGNTSYYRFSIKAVVKNFELRFPASLPTASKNANLFAAVRFKPRKKDTVTLPPLTLKPKVLLTPPIPIGPLPEPGQNFPKEWDWDNSSIAKELKATLGPLGTQVSGLISAGFLSGTQNATFIGGTVLDFDDGEIKPLVGANWEVLNFGSNLSGGFLFGVEPSTDASIFLGPSIQADLLTISAGARLSGGDDSIETDLAGVVSIDLSRLSGSRSNIKPIELKPGENVAGGNWFKAIDLVTKNLAMVRLTLKGDQECGEPNEKLQLEPGIPIDFQEDGISFLMKGEYKYKIPENCNLYRGGNLIAPYTTENIPAGPLYPLSEPSNPLYICKKTNIKCIQKAKLPQSP